MGVRFANADEDALGDPTDTTSLAYAIYSATTESDFNQAIETAASALDQYPSVGVVYEASSGDYDVVAPLMWDGDSGGYVPVSSQAANAGDQYAGDQYAGDEQASQAQAMMSQVMASESSSVLTDFISSFSRTDLQTDLGTALGTLNSIMDVIEAGITLSLIHI